MNACSLIEVSNTGLVLPLGKGTSFNRNWRQGIEVAIVFCILVATSAFGQNNDFCTNAVQVIPGQIYTTNILNATSNGDPATGWAAGLYRGVWYRVTPTNASQRVNVSTCG